MTRVPAAARVVVALLVRLLPAGFRERQRAEWSADLYELAAESVVVRWRYLLSAAWTLPELRAVVRAGRPSPLSVRGLRAGLGRPGTPGIVVLAVLVSLLSALFGAAWAARIGWEFSAPLPTGAQADDLKQTVFPGLAVIGGGDAPLWRQGVEHPGFGTAYYVIDPADAGDVGNLRDGVHDRLLAAGWHAVEHPDAGDPYFPSYPEASEIWMTRDGLVLKYDGGNDFTVQRAVPPWMAWVAVAGAAAGAMIGWLVTGWAGRRAAEGSAAAQLAGPLAWPAAVVVLFLLLGGLLLRPFGQTYSDVFYLRLLYIVEGPPRWVGAVAGAALGVVAVLGRRTST